MVLVCDTSTYHDEHLCQLIFPNSTTHDKVIGRTQTGFVKACAQRRKAGCDLDLKPSDMVLVCDTLSYHDNHLCQIILDPIMHNEVMGRTRTGFTEVYIQC